MCIIFNAWDRQALEMMHMAMKSFAKNSSKLNKFLHNEVNLLIQHIIVQDQDGQNDISRQAQECIKAHFATNFRENVNTYINNKIVVYGSQHAHNCTFNFCGFIGLKQNYLAHLLSTLDNLYHVSHLGRRRFYL